MDVSQAMSICFKNNVKVYPIMFKGSFKVQVSFDGKIKTFDKMIGKNEVNEALTKTYLHYAEKFNSRD